MSSSDTNIPTLAKQAKTPAYARLLVLGCWSLLLAMVWWRQLTHGISPGSVGFAVLYSLPLLAPLPGLLSNRRHTYTWATLCVLPYFTVGVTESIANGALRHWAMALLGAALLWFFALITYLRVTRQQVNGE